MIRFASHIWVHQPDHHTRAKIINWYTHGVISWSVLLERGRKRNRRHYSHWFPLLRLLSDMNSLCSEWLESRAEAVEHGALLISVVVLIHYNALLLRYFTDDSGWVCTLRNAGERHLTERRTALGRLSQSARTNKHKAALIGCLGGASNPRDTARCSSSSKCVYICKRSTDATLPIVWVRQGPPFK